MKTPLRIWAAHLARDHHITWCQKCLFKGLQELMWCDNFWLFWGWILAEKDRIMWWMRSAEEFLNNCRQDSKSSWKNRVAFVHALLDWQSGYFHLKHTNSIQDFHSIAWRIFKAVLTNSMFEQRYAASFKTDRKGKGDHYKRGLRNFSDKISEISKISGLSRWDLGGPS